MPEKHFLGNITFKPEQRSQYTQSSESGFKIILTLMIYGL